MNTLLCDFESLPSLHDKIKRLQPFDYPKILQLLARCIFIYFIKTI